MPLKGILVTAALIGVATTAGSLASRSGADSANGLPLPGWSAQAWATLPPAKEARLGHMGQLISSVAQDPSAKDGWVRAHPPVLPPDDTRSGMPEQGIIETSESSLPMSDYRLTNRWQALDGSTLVQIFAGGKADDPGKAVIVERVLRWPGTGVISTKVISPGNAAGPLRIVGASGMTLTLRASDGGRYSLDATSGVLAAL